jgi:carboxynorspermidine decarboxylase
LIISSYPWIVADDVASVAAGFNIAIARCAREIVGASDGLATPCYVYDRSILIATAQAVEARVRSTGASLLYSTKACSVIPVLSALLPCIDGFSCSSVLESTIAASLGPQNLPIHYVSPRIIDKDASILARSVDRISFNSAHQLERFGLLMHANGVSCGLRLNPRVSFGVDSRYDPCRPASKLGVDIDTLLAAVDGGLISGLHIHNNSDSRDLEAIVRTFDTVRSDIEHILPRLRWLNLGGGYDFAVAVGLPNFRALIEELRRTYSIEVCVEPGSSLVSRAGFLVTRIIDSFVSDGKSILMVDSTVNHYPDVLTYGFVPDLADSDSGESCQVVGGTCLAGDIFGTYTFAAHPKIGDVLVFTSVGAYSLVKAHMFNGVDLPTVYMRHEGGEFEIASRPSAANFAWYAGTEHHKVD